MAKLTRAAADDTPAEFSFVWRRWVGIAWFTVNSLILCWIISLIAKFGTLAPGEAIGALKWIGLTLIASNALMALLYYAGASAVDIGVIAQAITKVKSAGGAYDRSDEAEEEDDPEEPTPSNPDGEES